MRLLRVVSVAHNMHTFEMAAARKPQRRKRAANVAITVALITCAGGIIASVINSLAPRSNSSKREQFTNSTQTVTASVNSGLVLGIQGGAGNTFHVNLSDTNTAAKLDLVEQQLRKMDENAARVKDLSNDVATLRAQGELHKRQIAEKEALLVEAASNIFTLKAKIESLTPLTHLSPADQARITNAVALASTPGRAVTISGGVTIRGGATIR
jgi:hypothetical protein